MTLIAPMNSSSIMRDKENVPAYDIKLERVLGVTVSSNAALDCDSTSELIAYPAGCTVVLFHPRKNTQTHVLNGCRKTVTSLALSGDGRLLATGECGHVPNVRVWDISDSQNAIQITEFSGHKYGINCVAFSPSSKYVVSVGSQHDMIVNVWDWRNNVKVASNKVSSKVKAVSFAESGNYFVTVGNRHVKFWYLEYSRSAKYKEPVPLMGRSAILGEQRNNDFVDVACGKGEMADSTYAITKSGLLCEFNNRRLLDKWVELRTTSANCMAVGDKYIFIGCAEGIVRCFSPVTLQFITTLPRTHYLGVDVAQGLSISHMSQHPANARYPDAIALAFDEKNNKLTCVYNDHSIYVWDVRDIRRVGKSHSFLYHSACIWGVEMYPVGANSIGAMPTGSFITCSSDDTIRIWNLEKELSTNDTLYKKNIYSNELLKVLYVDPELTYLKDLDLAAAGSTEKNDASYDGRNGVRSIRVSPDGKHLASGDRSGNIRIHDVATLEEQCRIEAHDAEVLCLEYSKFSQHSLDSPKLLASASRDRLIHVFCVNEGYNFLQTLDDHSSSITAVRFFNQTNQNNQLQMVSCGADKSIIFRQLQRTPGGALQFTRGQNAQGKTTLYDMEVDSGQKYVLTACQDRNIRVYNVATGKHSKTFKGSIGEDGSLIKVVLDASGIYVATSCTDKTLCVYDYYSGECMATMLGHSELVTGLRFSPDCRHLVSASGDGCIFIWKVPHDMVVTMHARLAQQAMRAGKYSVQMNGDAVDLQLDNEIFGPPSAEFLDPNANHSHPAGIDTGIDYRFSIGQLPLWAKKQINTTNNDGKTSGSSGARSLCVDLPKGRWAQRVQQGDAITVKSVYDSDEVIPFPPPRGADSDGNGGGCGSKDSSIDSGTETKCSSDYRRESIIIKRESEETVFQSSERYRELTENSKQIMSGNIVLLRDNDTTELTRQTRSRHYTDDSSLGSFKFEDHESTEHDGDVEDYSEGENGTTGSEKSHHRLMYYPSPEDTTSNQFTVNAMDVEELRRSQRRVKKLKCNESGRSEIIASGSQDDSDSEGGASTPSAERNPLSMLSEASSEGFDQLVNQTHREKFLKNAFESLSGNEEHTSRLKSTSISSQFHERSSGGGEKSNYVGNSVNVSNQVKSNVDMVRKREELQRRIEETRKKLQSVGHRSSLKSSQSISDLSSHFTDKHHRQNRNNAGNGFDKNLSKLTKPNKSKTLPATKLKLNSLLLTNKIPGVGNPVTKFQTLKDSLLPKSRTTSCINDKYNNTSKRPVTLTLKKTEKYKVSLNKTNLSLPESPVYDELKTLKEHCKRNITRFENFGQKRKSCSYFIGLEDNEQDAQIVARSFESLPAINDYSFQNFAQSSDEPDDGNGNFSDDSLEGDFNNLPRRCVSDYQINLEKQSDKNYLSYQNFYRQVLTQSQESILSNVSIESFSKGSMEILDYNNYNNERHSSASFFLSRRDMKSGRSQESMLTDESEYQMMPLQKNANNQSTESVLTDDSDLLVKSAPLEMLFDSDDKKKQRNSETYMDKVENSAHDQNLNIGTAVFRSKSLQDTSCNLLNSMNEGKSPPEYYVMKKGADNFNNDKIKKFDTSKNNVSKKSRNPQSTLIFNDYVAHKPPKPKRNTFRTQSMRNRTRPDWNQCFQPMESQRVETKDFPLNESKNFKTSNEGNSQYYDEKKHVKRIQNNQNLLHFEKEDANNQTESCVRHENQTPTKDTESHNLLDVESAPHLPNKLLTVDPKFHSICANPDKKSDVRVSRAIQGTVKLLSKEFENLLLREKKNFTKNYRFKEINDKSFAERDTSRCKINREIQKHSGGEDSDCTDLSTMDKSLLESGSSTPLSSCTNSPKRMWPPASRCHNYMKYSKTLPTISQSHIPSKQQFPAVGTVGKRLPSKVVDSEDEDSGMRRTCSLSDLSINPPNKLLHGSIQVPGKLPNKVVNSSSRAGIGNPNVGLSRHSFAKSHSSHMTRSSSVGVLNQSDSESDAGASGVIRDWNSKPVNSRINALMRPTISSQNKVTHLVKANSGFGSNIPSVLRRRGMQGAYSTMNLSQISNQEDSSSEETSSNGNGKPSLPQRPRSISIDHSAASVCISGQGIKRIGSSYTVNNRPVEGLSAQNNSRFSLTNRNQLEPSPHELPVKDTDCGIDVTSADLSTQLCSTVADELTRTADNVVQLYKRLTLNDSDDPSNTTIGRDTMLRDLESSVNEAMRTLRLVVAAKNENNPPDNVSVNEATAKFQELLAGQDQSKVVNMMQQYSEMLLSMMQQRMGGSQGNRS